MKKVLFGTLLVALVGFGIYSCTKQQTQEPTIPKAQKEFGDLQLKSTQYYKSSNGHGKYYTMTTDLVQDTLFVSKYEVATDTSFRSTIYNLSGVPFTGDSIVIPSTGSYWWIPFEDYPPVLLSNGSAVNCTCDWTCCCFKVGGSCILKPISNQMVYCDCNKPLLNEDEGEDACKINTNGQSGNCGLIVNVDHVEMVIDL